MTIKVSTRDDTDDVWEFYRVNQAEIASAIRSKVPGGNVRIVDLKIEKGSVTIIVLAQITIGLIAIAVAILRNYDNIERNFKRAMPLLKQYVIDVTNSLKGLFRKFALGAGEAWRGSSDASCDLAFGVSRMRQSTACRIRSVAPCTMVPERVTALLFRPLPNLLSRHRNKSVTRPSIRAETSSNREGSCDMVFHRLWRAAVFLPLMLMPLQTSAETFGYSPLYDDLVVGKGVTGIDFGNPRPACVTFATEPLKRSRGYTRVSVIYNQTDISEALEFDSKANVGFLGQKASGYFNINQNYSSDTVAFTIVIESVQQADGVTMKATPAWTEHYATLIAQNKLEEVRKDCGDRYIQSESDDARLYALIDVHQNATKFGINVATGGSANFNVNIGTVSGTLGSDVDFKRAVQNNAISVRTYYQGLGGLKDASALVGITANDSIADIQGKLSAALASNTITGQPVSYDLTPYPGMPLIADLDDRVSAFLNKVKFQYGAAGSESTNIACLLQSCDSRAVLMSAEDRSLVTKYGIDWASYNDILRAIFVACADDYFRDNSKCANTLIPSVPIRPDVVQLIDFPIASWGSFQILVNDDHWLNRSEVTAVLTTGSSLLAATQSVDPGAKTVDVYADVISPYFSVAETNVPPALAAAGASDNQLLAKADEVPLAAVADFAAKGDEPWFGRPPGPKTLSAMNNLFPILHADVQQPCAFQSKMTVLGNDIKKYDDQCYSPLAARLAKSFSTNAMVFVTNEWAKSKGPQAYGGIHKVQWSEGLGGKFSTKFGPQLAAQYGVYAVDYVSNGVLCGYQLAFGLKDASGNIINLLADSGRLR